MFLISIQFSCCGNFALYSNWFQHTVRFRFDRRQSINRTLSFVTEGTKFTYQNIKETRDGGINYLHAKGPLLGPLVILASSTEVCKV